MLSRRTVGLMSPMPISDFRTHVPLSKYDSYKPFADRFNAQQCKQEDVENLFAPGLPDFLASTSSTTGTAPKLLARYASTMLKGFPSFFDPDSKNPLAGVVYCGCLGSREIEDASGKVVQKIPICLGTGRKVRQMFGWEFDDDDRRMHPTSPFYAVPWAATTISDYPSFLIVHGLFFLTHRGLGRFHVPFATLFVDLICHIDEQWNVLVACIRDGVLPDLEGIDRVRDHLQGELRADPERAAELLKIGPPFSSEGWAARVWPELSALRTVCTGSWILMFPKVRSILGPDVLIVSPGYGASESMVGLPYDVYKPEEFVLPCDKIIEFLDISQAEKVENLRQVWEVEVGKQYEPVITTEHGLWRYQLGDTVSVVGFHPETLSPIYKFLGRKSMKIRLPHAQIADFQLLEAIRANNSHNAVVQEFTTMVDDRSLPPTVGFFVELGRPLGLDAHLAPQMLFDALVAFNGEHLLALENGRMRLPTIRILKPGTFSEYRHRRAKKLKPSSGQFKIPTVLVDPTMVAWILERVVQEL